MAFNVKVEKNVKDENVDVLQTLGTSNNMMEVIDLCDCLDDDDQDDVVVVDVKLNPKPNINPTSEVIEEFLCKPQLTPLCTQEVILQEEKTMQSARYTVNVKKIVTISQNANKPKKKRKRRRKGKGQRRCKQSYSKCLNFGGPVTNMMNVVRTTDHKAWFNANVASTPPQPIVKAEVKSEPRQSMPLKTPEKTAVTPKRPLKRLQKNSQSSPFIKSEPKM